MTGDLGMTGEPVKVAVLITCHDRKTKTLACLERIFAQNRELAAGGRLEIRAFLVDDGCTDGTAEAVRERFPRVHVIRGDGQLYWCGGMRLAFEAAFDAEEDYSFYLWLNDDTFLYDDATSRLLATYRGLAGDGREDGIVVGSVLDPGTRKLSYGGLQRLWPLPFTRRVRPGDTPRGCSTMNGNCVLIPHSVAVRVGNVDPALTHLRGDVDYGLRASKLGFEVWVAPGFYGECEPNEAAGWRAPGLSLRERFSFLRHPKYAFEEKVLIARRHYGPLWFLSPLALYGAILLSHFRSGRRRSGTRNR